MAADITCYTILSRDVDLLSWCVNGARDRAGIDHDWLLIGWDCTDEVAQWCEANGVRLVRYEAKPEADFPNRSAWFLHNLYACWNLGYAEAWTPWVARMGSDQAFSRGWLRALKDAADRHSQRAVYHTWTVESPQAKGSRHPVHDFGITWDGFDQEGFDAYCTEVAHDHADRPVLTAAECGLYYRHRARGLQLRPDGVTWLQTKALWEEYGPLSDKVNGQGVTGDVSYMDALYDGGVPGYLVPAACSFHLVQGESRQTGGQG